MTWVADMNQIQSFREPVDFLECFDSKFYFRRLCKKSVGRDQGLNSTESHSDMVLFVRTSNQTTPF